jgi:hypothetical protein
VVEYMRGRSSRVARPHATHGVSIGGPPSVWWGLVEAWEIWHLRAGKQGDVNEACLRL